MINLNILADVVSNLDALDLDEVIDFRNSVEVALTAETRDFVITLLRDALWRIEQRILELRIAEERETQEWEDYADEAYYSIPSTNYQNRNYNSYDYNHFYHYNGVAFSSYEEYWNY